MCTLTALQTLDGPDEGAVRPTHAHHRSRASFKPYGLLVGVCAQMTCGGRRSGRPLAACFVQPAWRSKSSKWTSRRHTGLCRRSATPILAGWNSQTFTSTSVCIRDTELDLPLVTWEHTADHRCLLFSSEGHHGVSFQDVAAMAHSLLEAGYPGCLWMWRPGVGGPLGRGGLAKPAGYNIVQVGSTGPTQS